MILVGLTPQSGAQELDPQNFVIENAYIALADAEDVPVPGRQPGARGVTELYDP